MSSPPSRSNDFKDDLDFSSAGHGSSRFSNEYDPCPHLPLEGQKEGEEEDDDKCRGFLRGRPRATSASISSDEDLFLENQVAGGHSAEVSSSLPFEAIGGERSQVKRSRRKRRNTDDERGERERSEGEEEEEMDERMEIIEKDVAEEIERNLSENLRVTRSEVDLEGEGQKLCRSGVSDSKSVIEFPNVKVREKEKNIYFSLEQFHMIKICKWLSVSYIKINATRTITNILHVFSSFANR